MADISKVAPGSPIIPPVLQDRRVDDKEKEKQKREPGDEEHTGNDSQDNNEDHGKTGDGIDVYV